MITSGNLSGNTFDALLSRLSGRPAEGSGPWGELATLVLLALAMPFVALGMLVRVMIGHGRGAGA